MPELAEYPIVVLENDAPEQVGKHGLFDLYMPVGSTGLIFVAAVPGILRWDGPEFTEVVQRAANLRAASTLVQMGLIRGESFAFLREALRLHLQDLADGLGTTAAKIVDWESNVAALPFNVWTWLAQQACIADGRAMPGHHALCPDWRPRVIRVFPNVPARGQSQSNPQNNAPQQHSALPGADCYPPPCC